MPTVTAKIIEFLLSPTGRALEKEILFAIVEALKHIHDAENKSSQTPQPTPPAQ